MVIVSVKRLKKKDEQIKKRKVPFPPRAIAFSPLQGGGRGKVKTTRNNTLPLPSPKAGLLNGGPRIHAQRKFAQGAQTPFPQATLQYPEPKKKEKQFKKRIITPISPPLKRPKTEDFLTFLCFRGTPALPPELDYFNFPQPIQNDFVPKKKKLKASVAVGVAVGPDPVQEAKTAAAETKVQKSSVILTPQIKKNQPSGGIAKKSVAPEFTPKKKVCSALISPSASRINEQDAKFAMTALKLKYQEKRLASARPATNLITMLTKKVKERSMVLTRSRAKTAVGPLKTSPIQRKLAKPLVIKPRPIPRSAPSPDIILGVGQSPIKTPSKQPSSSSDSSDSSEEEESKKKSSESSSSSDENETKPSTSSANRALRSGKRSEPQKPSFKSRVGTRASHRTSKSPLRELPMWNVNAKKKKILQKYKNSSRAKAQKELSSKGHLTRSSIRKGKEERTSRKSKETAAIYLGLINKGFSSDEELESGGESDKDNESSPGDSSASETKFLEKHYNNSLKKEVPKKKKVKKESEKPSRRVLRSQSGSSIDSSRSRMDSASVRRKLLMMTCGKDTAGAARKSAKIISRGRRPSSSEEEGDDEEEEEEKGRSSAIDTEDEKETESEEEQIVTRSRSVSNSPSISKSESTPRESQEEEESQPSRVESEEEEEVEKVTIGIQVDMDLEEEEAKKAEAEAEAEVEAEPEDDTDEPTSPEMDEAEGQSARTKGITLPLSSEQKAQLQEAQEEDDEIQEIGQVINNPSTVRRRRASPSPPIITEGPRITHIHPTPPNPQPAQQPHPQSIPIPPIPPIPPIQRTSMTYTSHHINLGGPFVPSYRPDHFYPGLYAPTHLVNSVLVGSSGMDFGEMNPLSTLSIPVSVPTLPQYPNLMPPLLSSTTMTTSLQTHIRTVATNLDIPLVRPAQDPFQAMAGHHQLGMPLMGHPPLTRPNISGWSHAQAQAAAAEASRNHFSAFRLPQMGPKPQLPVSIVQPRMTSHYQSSAPAPTYPENIRNLPHVSIVPKFDRSGVKATLPSQNPKPSTSSTSSSSSRKSESEERRKKKKASTLPTPSSPLTVRKDTNPATYQGSSGKKLKERVEEAPSTSKGFDKHLVIKQERIEEPQPQQGPSKSSPSPALRLDQIKQETRKSSPSLSRPSSSSSANSQISSKKKRDSPKRLEAPTYHPSEQEFEDPLKYFEKILPEAERFGMARIVPPRSFRPECNVNDDMRFTAYNHYIHKMFKRWGPTVKETEAIKEHLKRNDMDTSSIPVIGGIEIDFSTLYQQVQSLGGLREVMEKEKWAEVADKLHIPKGTHDRAAKLDSVYVKYILPYDTLSEKEREGLKKGVEEKWRKREVKLREKQEEEDEDEESDEDSMDELDECVVKGKGTPLSAYWRTARNTVGMVFREGKEPEIGEVEEEYWRIVREGKKHLCVYSGSIDCAGVGWGFPQPKANKHPWNLKVLANNNGSVLKSMGPVMGATVPTLHVSMLFTSYCWYRDPHGLSWVEYLHSGARKIWYSVAARDEPVLRKALMKLMPLQCKNKKVWLPSDSVMVPLELLEAEGVKLVRAVQNPGEFLVVFPKSYTSAICTGYLVSESVCFAPLVWLKTCMEMFKDIRESKEPPVFPVEKLLLSIIRDNKANSAVVKMAGPLAEKVISEELSLRKKLLSLGVKEGGKPTKNGSKGSGKKKKSAGEEEEYEQCYFCNYILSMSLVRNERTDFVTCLAHAIQHLTRHKAQIKKCTMLCEDTQEELESVLQTAKKRAN